MTIVPISIQSRQQSSVLLSPLAPMNNTAEVGCVSQRVWGMPEDLGLLVRQPLTVGPFLE